MKQVQEENQFFPLLETAQIGDGSFYKYLICQEESNNCLVSYFSEDRKVFKGLTPGKYQLSLFICDYQIEKSCKQRGVANFVQKPYLDPKNELIHKIAWVNKAILQEKMINMYDELSKFSSALDSCNRDAQDPELNNYIAFLKTKLKAPIETQFEYLSVDNFEVSLTNIVGQNQLSLTSDKTIPVRLILWHYSSPKPIFSRKDKSLKFDLEGLKQTLLGKRYGHSALLIGNRTLEGGPSVDDSYYLSYPTGNDYERDIKKYKKFTVIDLPNVSPSSFSDFKRMIYYSVFETSLPDESFQELLKKRDSLAKSISENLGIEEGEIVDFFVKHKRNYRTKFPGYKKNPVGSGIYKQKLAISLLDKYYFNQLEISKTFKLHPEEKSFYQSILESSRKNIHDILGFDDSAFLEEMIDGHEDIARNNPKVLEGTTKDAVLAEMLWFKRSNKENNARKKEYLEAYSDFVEAKGVLARKELPYGEDFSFTGKNCSCATGMGMEALYKTKSLFRKGYIPPDPLDNLKRVDRLKSRIEGKMWYQNKLARKTGIFAGISSVLASAAVGAYYLNQGYFNILSNEQKKIDGSDFSLAVESRKLSKKCLSDAFKNASQLFKKYRLDLNTQITGMILNQ